MLEFLPPQLEKLLVQELKVICPVLELFHDGIGDRATLEVVCQEPEIGELAEMLQILDRIVWKIDVGAGMDVHKLAPLEVLPQEIDSGGDRIVTLLELDDCCFGIHEASSQCSFDEEGVVDRCVSIKHEGFCMALNSDRDFGRVRSILAIGGLEHMDLLACLNLTKTW